jgi:rhodanese-related sulfurtransferase
VSAVLAGAAGVDRLLDEARTGLRRLGPQAAHQAWLGGAELVDIRPAAQRAEEGEVPGALVVERNVLEWRFDPQSRWHLPEVTGYDRSVIVVCQEGYASSFAAASLRELGHQRVADLIGGFAAWAAAGLPVQPARARLDS